MSARTNAAVLLAEPTPRERVHHPLPTPDSTRSDRAGRDMEWLRLESFRLCQWRNVAFPHLETDPERLQRSAPFTLDLLNGRAFVSLVAFTLKDMRPRVGGCVFRKLFNPFGTHRFLNVRTYVKGEDSRGIYFLSAFLDARRLNLITGPLLYGLRFYTGRLVSNTPQARTESQVLFFERAVPCAMPDE